LPSPYKKNYAKELLQKENIFTQKHCVTIDLLALENMLKHPLIVKPP
jgi:hypothetical protein